MRDEGTFPILFGLGALLFSAAALATSGSSESVESVCLEAGGKRVLYERSEGMGPSLRALELATGRDEPLTEADPDVALRLRLLEGCVPLAPVPLEQAGMRAASRTPPGGDVHRLEASRLPRDAFLWRPMHPQVLTLRAGGRRRLTERFEVCFATKDHAEASAYPLPGRSAAVVVLSYPGLCYEGGYRAVLVRLVSGVKSRSAAPAESPAETSTRIELQPPALKYEGLLTDAGKVLVRAGRFADAAGYLEAAYEGSKYLKAPSLEALFLEAAALARAGDPEAAISSLRELLSYGAKRKRFRARVKNAPAFKPLLETEPLRELLADEACCAAEVEEKTYGSDYRSRREWRWRDGERIVVHSEAWQSGVKVLDEKEGVLRKWNVAGWLELELKTSPDGTGIGTRYRRDGSVESVLPYRDGLPVLPADPPK